MIFFLYTWTSALIIFHHQSNREIWCSYVLSKIKQCLSQKKYFNRTFPIWEIFQTWHGGRLHTGGHVHQPHGRRGLAHCRQPYQPHACEIYYIAYTCLDFLICQVLNSTSHCSSVKYVRQPCWRCTTAQVGQPTPSHGANFNLWASNPLGEFSQFLPQNLWHHFQAVSLWGRLQVSLRHPQGGLPIQPSCTGWPYSVITKIVFKTRCRILCSMRLQCVSKILTPRRMLKKTSLIA